MGKEDVGNYLKLREEYYDQWRSEAFGHKDFPLEEINELIRKVGGEEIDPTCIHLQRFRY